MGNFPRKVTWQAEKGPIVANHSNRVSRWQRRLGRQRRHAGSGATLRRKGRSRRSGATLAVATLEDELAQNSCTQRRFERLSSDVYAAVFSHSGGPEAKGGEIGGRRCYFSRVGSVFAPPKSTCRAEQKPIVANQLARAPRWQCRVGLFAAGVDCPYGKLPNF